MTLPPFYLIIDKSFAQNQAAAQILAACARGIRLIRLRAADATSAQYLSWITPLIPLAQQHGAQVLIDDKIELLIQVSANGVHLNTHSLAHYQQRPIAKEFYLAISTHTPEELRQAEKLHPDFVTLSPVKKTATHPEAIPLGWPLFADWVKQTKVPVYALGGLTTQDLAIAQQHGACGVAGIRGI